MIETNAALDQAIQQLERMYRALAELHSRVRSQSPANFQLLAEGPIDEIRRLQREIGQYLGIDETALTAAE